MICRHSEDSFIQASEIEVWKGTTHLDTQAKLRRLVLIGETGLERHFTGSEYCLSAVWVWDCQCLVRQLGQQAREREREVCETDCDAMQSGICQLFGQYLEENIVRQQCAYTHSIKSSSFSDNRLDKALSKRITHTYFILSVATKAQIFTLDLVWTRLRQRDCSSLRLR